MTRKLAGGASDPQADVVAALRDVKRLMSAVPIVALVGVVDVRWTREVIEEAAQDDLPKLDSSTELLPRPIRHGLVRDHGGRTTVETLLDEG